MTNKVETSSESENYQRLGEMIAGSVVSQAIGVAAKLGIADRIQAGMVSTDDLAEAVGADANRHNFTEV